MRGREWEWKAGAFRKTMNRRVVHFAGTALEFAKWRRIGCSPHSDLKHECIYSPLLHLFLSYLTLFFLFPLSRHRQSHSASTVQHLYVLLSFFSFYIYILFYFIHTSLGIYTNVYANHPRSFHLLRHNLGWISHAWVTLGKDRLSREQHENNFWLIIIFFFYIPFVVFTLFKAEIF